MERKLLAAVVFGSLLLCTSVTRAQERSPQEISFQGTGFFTKNASGKTSTGDRINQHATNTGGLLLSYRYYFNRWLGADVSYGYDRNTQKNLVTTAVPGGPIGGPGPAAVTIPFNVQTNVHQATAAGVVRIPGRPFHLNPYVLAGTGALVFSPTGNGGGAVPGASTQAKAAFAWGGGADWDLGSHFAARLEYRGFAYGRPSLGLPNLNSHVTTYTSQPSAGIIVRF